MSCDFVDYFQQFVNNIYYSGEGGRAIMRLLNFVLRMRAA